MRRSSLTSKFACVVLFTLMYLSGIGNDSSLREKSVTGFNVIAVSEVEALQHGVSVKWSHSFGVAAT